jgi:energy-coupling factor transport system permease protein
MSSQFELLRNVTIGQYIPTNSVVHRLDPRAKIISALLLILAVSFTRSIIPVMLMFLVILLIAAVSKIPFSYLLRGVILGLPILVLVFAVQFIFQGWTEPAGRVFFEWGWIRVTRFSFQLISVGLIRILCFIFITSLITMTATVTELTHGVEQLLSPFRRFGVPSHEIALINMIALRFVPTFAEEMERVMKAQASRCADIGGNSRFWRPDKAARAYLPLIVPLFINAFRRAEELILAMEARSYIGGDGRTKFITLKSSRRDYLVVIASLIFFIFIATFRWPALRDLLALIGLEGL